jgi:peptidyl-prolyl cis-trans isomerase D
MDNSEFDARKFGTYLFIFALAVLFALEWGPGSRGCSGQTGQKTTEDVAATVNGKDIPLKDFLRSYAYQMNQFRAQGGLPPGMAKQLGLHTQILEQLINTELLAQAAEQRGIRASDSELSEMLFKNPDFQKDGAFDEDQYKSVLRDFYRRTPVEFEADMRRRLSAGKMLELIEQAATVSDDEVKSRYMKDANKAKAVFVRFANSMYVGKVEHSKDANPKAWAEKHEKQIADHYAANQFNYHQPERAKVRSLLIKVMKEDPEAKRTEGKQKADNLIKEIKGGKDFAEMAKNFSDDQGTRESGGDLGFVERNALPPAVADAVFKANIGDVVGPIETPIGYYLAKIEDKKAPETLPLEKVRMDIALQLYLKERASEVAKAEAEKALMLARGGKALIELFPPDKDSGDTGVLKQFQAKEAKPEAVETVEFSSTAMTIPQLGPAEDAAKDVFKRTEPGLLDKIYPLVDGYAVVQVTERAVASDANFESTKDQIKTEATKAKQFELRESFVKSMRKQATVKINESAIDKVAEG